MDNYEGTIIAVDGGEQVRTKSSPYQCIGAHYIGDEELALVKQVIQSKTLFRYYRPGTPHMVEDFETEVRKLIGTRYALATATGSGAYFCVMAALGIGPGDEVIIPAYGWITDYNCVAFMGATPVFADIDESFNISPEDIKKRLPIRPRLW